MRTFETGATRDDDSYKYDPEGFLSPLALDRFFEYMHVHRRQADGNLRDSDNWQKGLPLTTYMKSLLRHVFDLWKLHRGYAVYDRKTRLPVTKEDSLCAAWFNTQGYLHVMLKEKINGEQSQGSGQGPD